MAQAANILVVDSSVAAKWHLTVTSSNPVDATAVVWPPALVRCSMSCS